MESSREREYTVVVPSTPERITEDYFSGSRFSS
jgi:hypothetical protein